MNQTSSQPGSHKRLYLRIKIVKTKRLSSESSNGPAVMSETDGYIVVVADGGASTEIDVLQHLT